MVPSTLGADKAARHGLDGSRPSSSDTSRVRDLLGGRLLIVAVRHGVSADPEELMTYATAVLAANRLPGGDP